MYKVGCARHYYRIIYVLLFFLLISGCVAQHVKEGNGDYFFSFDSAVVKPLVAPRGGELTVEWTYTIRNVPVTGIQPREKIAVYKRDKLLAVLQEKPFRTTDGTWQDYLTFELPHGLSAGNYTIEITLTDSHTTYTKKIMFDIR